MSDAMENAAKAFDAALGNAPARPASSRSESNGDAPEPIFQNLGEHLDTSEENAGGDDEPAPKPKKAKPDPELIEDDEGEGPEDDEDEEEDDEEGSEEDDDELTDEEKAALEDEEEDPATKKLMNTEFEVMVDGVPKQVKLKEALDGYIRMDTFHQRLNQLNEVKTTMTEEAQIIVKDRQKYTTMLKEAEDILSEMMPEEPDWDKEFAADGVRANALRKQYDAFKGKVAEIRGKREEAEREGQQQSIRETTKFAQSEYVRFSKVAGWKSQEDQLRDTKSMRKTGLALGFSDEELSQVYDSRMLQALLKASKYDRMMASRPKAVVKNGKTQQVSLGAGRTVSRTAPKGVSAAQARLSKTGSIDDAATVFDQLLSQNRKRSRNG